MNLVYSQLFVESNMQTNYAWDFLGPYFPEPFCKSCHYPSVVQQMAAENEMSEINIFFSPLLQ